MAKSAGDAIDEFLKEIAVVEKLYPESDEQLLFYRRYRIAYYHSPLGKLPCHLCQQACPNHPPAYIAENKMDTHCNIKHPKAATKCGYNDNKCTVRFNTSAEKDLHIYYSHTKQYGWWTL